MEAGTVSKHVALPHQMARPPLGDLALSVDDKKDISPMAAILRSRGHLQHNAAIPGSPTDKLMSPTSRQLRKKGHIDSKYGLHETRERLSFTDDDDGGIAAAESNVVLGSASTTKRRILEERGWVFTVLESNRDLEQAVGKSTDSALHVAKTIAHALLPHFEDAEKPVILLTVAQVYKVGDLVHHPPSDEAAAIALWQTFSGCTVLFQTAVVATVCPCGNQVFDIDDASVSFQTISKDMATRLAKRNYTENSKNCPIHDVELKLRCRIESGTENSVLGMPVGTCERLLKDVLEAAPKEIQDKLTTIAVPPPPLGESK